MSEFQLIEKQEDFDRAMTSLRGEPVMAFDLESNGFFRYPERVCLIQIAAAGMAMIVDPLSVEDMAPLGRILRDGRTEIVLHAGDHDIRSLDRDWGWRVKPLFDTSVGAAFVGMDRLGLSAVLESALGVKIGKDKKIQRSDWSQRPLKPKWLEYAANDVLHLERLKDTLESRLRKLGRLEWAREESARIGAIRYQAQDPETAVFRVKGSQKLKPKQLAILNSLVAYRERHTLRMGRPHFRVIPDATLVALAENPDASLGKVKGLGRFAKGGLASGLRRAIRDGRGAEPPRRPREKSDGRRLSKERAAAAAKRLNKMKAWRSEVGKELALDPALVWPMRSLKRIAAAPDSFDEEARSEDVRRWQRSEFEPTLRKLAVSS